MPTNAKGTRSASRGAKAPRKRLSEGTTIAKALMKTVEAKRAGRAKSSVEIIAEQMPGWKIAPATDKRSSDLAMEGDMKIETGPSITQLRRKFLGGEDADDGADEASIYKAVDRRVRTVRVEPKAGGAAKTADIRGGKITIVQG